MFPQQSSALLDPYSDRVERLSPQFSAANDPLVSPSARENITRGDSVLRVTTGKPVAVKPFTLKPTRYDVRSSSQTPHTPHSPGICVCGSIAAGQSCQNCGRPWNAAGGGSVYDSAFGSSQLDSHRFSTPPPSFRANQEDAVIMGPSPSAAFNFSGAPSREVHLGGQPSRHTFGHTSSQHLIQQPQPRESFATATAAQVPQQPRLRTVSSQVIETRTTGFDSATRAGSSSRLRQGLVETSARVPGSYRADSGVRIPPAVPAARVERKQYSMAAAEPPRPSPPTVVYGEPYCSNIKVIERVPYIDREQEIRQGVVEVTERPAPHVPTRQHTVEIHRGASSTGARAYCVEEKYERTVSPLDDRSFTREESRREESRREESRKEESRRQESMRETRGGSAARRSNYEETDEGEEMERNGRRRALPRPPREQQQQGGDGRLYEERRYKKSYQSSNALQRGGRASRSRAKRRGGSSSDGSDGDSVQSRNSNRGMPPRAGGRYSPTAEHRDEQHIKHTTVRHIEEEEVDCIKKKKKVIRQETSSSDSQSPKRRKRKKRQPSSSSAEDREERPRHRDDSRRDRRGRDARRQKGSAASSCSSDDQYSSDDDKRNSAKQQRGSVDEKVRRCKSQTVSERKKMSRRHRSGEIDERDDSRRASARKRNGEENSDIDDESTTRKGSRKEVSGSTYTASSRRNVKQQVVDSESESEGATRGRKSAKKRGEAGSESDDEKKTRRPPKQKSENRSTFADSSEDDAHDARVRKAARQSPKAKVEPKTDSDEEEDAAASQPPPSRSGGGQQEREKIDFNDPLPQKKQPLTAPPAVPATPPQPSAAATEKQSGAQPEASQQPPSQPQEETRPPAPTKQLSEQRAVTHFIAPRTQLPPRLSSGSSPVPKLPLVAQPRPPPVAPAAVRPQAPVPRFPPAVAKAKQPGACSASTFTSPAAASAACLIASASASSTPPKECSPAVVAKSSVLPPRPQPVARSPVLPPGPAPAVGSPKSQISTITPLSASSPNDTAKPAQSSEVSGSTAATAAATSSPPSSKMSVRDRIQSFERGMSGEKRVTPPPESIQSTRSSLSSASPKRSWDKPPPPLAKPSLPSRAAAPTAAAAAPLKSPAMSPKIAAVAAAFSGQSSSSSTAAAAAAAPSSARSSSPGKQPSTGGVQASLYLKGKECKEPRRVTRTEEVTTKTTTTEEEEIVTEKRRQAAEAAAAPATATGGIAERSTTISISLQKKPKKAGSTSKTTATTTTTTTENAEEERTTAEVFTEQLFSSTCRKSGAVQDIKTTVLEQAANAIAKAADTVVPGQKGKVVLANVDLPDVECSVILHKKGLKDVAPKAVRQFTKDGKTYNVVVTKQP